MTRPPLAIRLTGPGVDRHLEHELVDDLQFGSVMPGGYDSASWSVQRALEDMPPELYPYTRYEIQDARDGRVLNAGRLQLPGRGQPWKVTTAGSRAAAGDVSRPWVYADSRAGELAQTTMFVNVDPARVEQIGGGSTTPGVRILLPRGVSVALNAQVGVAYPHLGITGQLIGRMTATHSEGVTGATAGAIIEASPLGAGTSSSTGFANDTWSTGTQTLVARRGAEITVGGGFDAPYPIYKYANLSSAFTVGNDVTWSNLSAVLILPARYDKAGNRLDTSANYGTDYVLPDQVVADLLGSGFLPSMDGAGAAVSTFSTTQITQLAYTDGTDAAGVLTDLMALDPSMRWAAWEPNSAGAYRFEWSTWPTAVSWEVDAAAVAFNSSGGDPDLYDRARALWRDDRQRTRWTSATQDAPLLTAAGLSRSAVVDLGSDAGSSAQATAAAAAYLALHRNPTNNGTLTITAPIFDRVAGRMLQPWELVAGGLVRVRNLAPRVDALNATDRDGSSVFRVTEVRYSRNRNAATVTLDSYSDSLYKALTRVARFASRTAKRR